MNTSKEHSNIFSSILSQSMEDRGYEDYVLKLSNGKCFLNRRYLVLRNGIVAYYREKPSEFQSLSAPQPKPKGKVHILDTEIRRVDPAFAKKKNYPHMFQISFTMSGKQKKTFWIFAVTSESILVQWLEAFERSKNPVLAIDEEKEDGSESVGADKESELKEEKEKVQREENFKKTLELERQRSEKKQKEIEEVKKKEEAEKDIKRKEEEKKRKLLEKADKKRIEKNHKLLQNFWDYRFQSLITSFLVSSNPDAIIEIGLKIFQLVGSFRESSKHAAEVIINDIQLPVERRKFKKLNDSAYIYQNFLIHLSWQQDLPDEYKHLGHEFRACDMLQDAIFFLSKSDRSFRLRLPLSCIVDFKGFRALVTAIIPLDTDLTVLHGLKKPDYYLTESSLYGNLSSLAQVLNIKEQVFQWEHGIIPMVHLSVFTQIHESLGYSRIEDLDGFNDETSVIYIEHTSEILPIDMDFNYPPKHFMDRLRPEYFSDYGVALTANACINYTQEALEEDDFEICEASLKLRTDKISEIVELLDSLTIMPIDSKSMTQAMHASGINCRYLGLIAHKTALPHIKDLCIVEIIARTCKNLLFQQLAELMMESTEEKQIDLTEATNRNHLASSVKNLEGNYFVENFEDPEALSYSDVNIQNLFYRKGAFLARYKKILGWPNYKSLKKNSKEILSPRQNLSMEGSLKECIVDYLNLIFGVGEESEIFWQEILVRKATSFFNINEERIDKSQINLHALLHAVGFHCGLQLAFSKETMLGKVENPFSLQSLEKIKEKTKIMNLKGIESRIISARLEGVDHSDLSLENSLISLEINKVLNPEKDYLGDTVLLSDIGEIMLERSDLESAIKYAKDALLQIHPLHAEGVKSWCILIRAMMENSMQDEALQCFDHALTALEYHWGPYHPLHCTLYSILAYLYMKKSNFEEALILYKNSLMCSLRVLGPNHPHTAEVYIELGNLYVQQHNLTEATAAIEKGFSVYEASLGKNSLVTVTAGVKLAQLYTEMGKFEKVMPLISAGLNAHEHMIQNLAEEDSRNNSAKIERHFEKIQEILEVALKFAKTTNNQGLVKGIMEKIEKVQQGVRSSAG